jgi:hypothetical protein
MIVENIDDYACIFMVPGSNPLLTEPCDLMHIGEGVYIAVDQDAFFHLVRIILVTSPLYVIAHKIPYNDLLIASREVGMGQKIHSFLYFFEFRKKYSKNFNI